MKGWGAHHHCQALGFYSKMGSPKGFGAKRATCLNSGFSRTTLACCAKMTVETVKRYCSNSGKRQRWPVLVADGGVRNDQVFHVFS